jgi:hypothetical protein
MVNSVCKYCVDHCPLSEVFDEHDILRVDFMLQVTECYYSDTFFIVSFLLF